MITELEHLLVPITSTIRDAMEAIQANARGIVLIVDETGVLRGSLTDGDIRRAILSNTALSNNVAAAMNSKPRICSVDDDPLAVYEEMKRNRLMLMPALDSGVPVAAWDFRELSSRLGRAQEKPVTAVLMAGGLGSRLGDITRETPKPLIEVGGKPILERIVTHLQESGLEEVTITTRYLGEQIEAHFGDGEQLGVNINYVREDKRLGTAGALKYLEGQIEETFLVMNADLLTHISVADLVRFHRDHEATMTVAVRRFTMQVPYGVVDVEGVDIISISEKPNLEFFVNAGIYILEPAALQYIPQNTYFDITELMERLLENDHRVVSFPVHESWMDIGRPEDLETARGLYKNNESRTT